MVLLPDFTAPTTARRQVSSATWAWTWDSTFCQCWPWSPAWGKSPIHSRAKSSSRAISSIKA